MPVLLDRGRLSVLVLVLSACNGNAGLGSSSDTLGEYREYRLASSKLKQRLASGDVEVDRIYVHESDRFTFFYQIGRLPAGEPGRNTVHQMSASFLTFQGESLFTFRTAHCSPTIGPTQHQEVAYSGPSESSTTLFTFESQQYVVREFVVLDNIALHRTVCGQEITH